MRFTDSFALAWEALAGNRARSFLALLGIVIGVFAVVAMVSLGQMATTSIMADLEGFAGRSILAQPAFGQGEILGQEDLEALAYLPVHAYPQVSATAFRELANGQRQVLLLVGTVGDLPRLDPSVRITQGRYFSAGEADSGLPVAAVNSRLARDVFGNADPVGKPLRLLYPEDAWAEVSVVGIFESGEGAAGQFPQVNVPIEFLWATHPQTKPGEYPQLVVRVDPGYDILEIQGYLERILNSRHPAGSIQILSLASLSGLVGNVSLVLQGLLGGIAGISLLVGGVGIMNIMLVSVTERTREIGLRKAVGASSGAVRTQFLLEAMLLTASGGVIGVALAALVLYLVSRNVSFFDNFVLSPLTAGVAILISVAIGLFFGVFPATQAARLEPIQALRSE